MASVASRPRALPRLGSLPNSWVLPALVLLGLLLVSAYLRTDSLGASLWMDEGLSIGIASQPLLDIPGTLQVDGSPPLYYMLLSVWMDAGRRRSGRYAGAVGGDLAARRSRAACGPAGASSAAAPGSSAPRSARSTRS